LGQAQGWAWCQLVVGQVGGLGPAPAALAQGQLVPWVAGQQPLWQLLLHAVVAVAGEVRRLAALVVQPPLPLLLAQRSLEPRSAAARAPL
jgi:hypothetical protein